MTYYDREDQFLRQRLQKEIPILTALIKNLYGELDKKFHLNGAKVPVTFGFVRTVWAPIPDGAPMKRNIFIFHFFLLHMESRIHCPKKTV